MKKFCNTFWMIEMATSSRNTREDLEECRQKKDKVSVSIKIEDIVVKTALCPIFKEFCNNIKHYRLYRTSKQ